MDTEMWGQGRYVVPILIWLMLGVKRGAAPWDLLKSCSRYGIGSSPSPNE
jgi:hypothetical protein